jgi:arylformamidase
MKDNYPEAKCHGSGRNDMSTAEGRYRGYDQRELEWQYDPDQWLPDGKPVYLPFFREYLDESAQAVGSLRCYLDVPYGPGPHETLDIFPAPLPQAPVLVFIHGGYWQEIYGTEYWRFLAPAYVETGVTYVAVDYAVVPEVTFDGMVRGNRAALAWLVQHAAEYGADPQRIHVSGHSAGAHLTTMLLATDWPTLYSEIPAQPIAGACAVSGIYDLEPVRLTSINDALGLDTESARRNSPLFSIPKRAPELLLCVGGLESAEFHRQQDEFLDVWRAAGLVAHVVDMPGYHHYDLIQQFGNRESALFTAMREQIEGSRRIRAER